MLNFIAKDLRYIGLNRVVNVRSGEVTWSTLMELGERSIFHAAGVSPDDALANVLNKALEGRDIRTLDTTLCLDQLAADLLQLVIRPSQSGTDSDKSWNILARFQQKRAFWNFWSHNEAAAIQIVGSSPDEVLNRLVQRARK